MRNFHRNWKRTTFDAPERSHALLTLLYYLIYIMIYTIFQFLHTHVNANRWSCANPRNQNEDNSSLRFSRFFKESVPVFRYQHSSHDKSSKIEMNPQIFAERQLSVVVRKPASQKKWTRNCFPVSISHCNLWQCAQRAGCNFDSLFSMPRKLASSLVPSSDVRENLFGRADVIRRVEA